MTDQLDLDLARLDEAEARLTQRAEVRGELRARRARRRELRRRLLGKPTLVPGLALAGTLVLLVTLGLSGGDLSSWPRALALLALAAIFLAPPLIAGRAFRMEGTTTLAAAAAATLGLQLILTFAVAFLLLGLGPA